MVLFDDQCGALKIKKKIKKKVIFFKNEKIKHINGLQWMNLCPRLSADSFQQLIPNWSRSEGTLGWRRLCS